MNWLRLGKFLLQLLPRLLASKIPSAEQYSAQFSLLCFNFPVLRLMNSSTETISANLEVAEDDAITLLFSLVKADRERRENRCDFFHQRRFSSAIGDWSYDNFHSWENSPTNQIASSFQQVIFIWQIML